MGSVRHFIPNPALLSPINIVILHSPHVSFKDRNHYFSRSSTPCHVIIFWVMISLYFTHLNQSHKRRSSPLQASSFPGFGRPGFGDDEIFPCYPIWLVVLSHLPLWKRLEWKSIGMICPFPTVSGKIKFIFQTTHQICSWLNQHQSTTDKHHFQSWLVY